MGVIIVNGLFLMTTLITDFERAFYRKASAYKKKVKTAIAARNNLMEHEKAIYDENIRKNMGASFKLFLIEQNA